jgi:hypothetical protein
VTRTWRTNWDSDNTDYTGQQGSPTASAAVPAKHQTGGILASGSGSWSGRSYTPGNGSTPTSGFSYSAEADLCWDCHVGGNGEFDYGNFGLGTSKIFHYDDGSARWQTWDTRTYSFKTPNGGTANLQSSHFKAKSTATNYANMNGSSQGQCTPCHDPHGIADYYNIASPSYSNGTPAFLSGDATHDAPKFPLLKGNWLTSPYKEDAVGNVNEYTQSSMSNPQGWVSPYTGLPVTPGPTPRENPNLAYNNPEAVGHGYGTGHTSGGTYGTGGSGHTGYFIDDNTWGVTGDGATYWNGGSGPSVNWPTSGPMRTAGTYANHAGLCSVCHDTNQLLVGTTVGSLGSLHNTVKGVGGASAVANVFGAARGNETHLSDNALSTNNVPFPHGVAGDGTSPDEPAHGQLPAEYGTANGMVAQFEWDDGGTPGDPTDDAVVANWDYFWGYYSWAVTPADMGGATGGSLANQPHRFSCSKCHSPHAKPLPRLMRTNCLETSQLSNSTVARTRYVYSYEDRRNGRITVNANDQADGTNTMACHGEDYSPAWNNVTPWDGAAAPDGTKQNW